MTKVNLAELQKLQPRSEDWNEKLDHIESAVQQHIYQECKVNDLAGHRLPEFIAFRGGLHRVFCR
jgi:membrane protein insertase Oxa1/YidC/SpoIIIJ